MQCEAMLFELCIDNSCNTLFFYWSREDETMSVFKYSLLPRTWRYIITGNLNKMLLFFEYIGQGLL